MDYILIDGLIDLLVDCDLFYVYYF